MIVAALRLTFAVPPDGGSNKSIAQKIKDRLWSHFKVAVAEVNHHSSQELVMGVSFVGATENGVKDRVQEIIRHLSEWPNVELVYDESEVIHFNDLELERDLEKYDPTL